MGTNCEAMQIPDWLRHVIHFIFVCLFFGIIVAAAWSAALFEIEVDKPAQANDTKPKHFHVDYIQGSTFDLDNVVNATVDKKIDSIIVVVADSPLNETWTIPLDNVKVWTLK